MQKLIPIKRPDGVLALPGFRLKRLEMLNWGTFNGKIERLMPDCRWTLISGGNGTGKSTAADALRTLLVPPAKLSYNDASLDQKMKTNRRDRTKKTYIRGAYSSSSQEDSATAILKYHRAEGEQSILLGVFSNEITGVDVTLAQILWVSNDEYDQYYLIARQDRNIKEHLTQLGTGRDVKRTLQMHGFEVCGSFAAYETKFRSYLCIKGQGALEVFNQVIGVKEVNDLNSFIRRHLLEPSDTPRFINDHLKPHFSQLSGCWSAIERAEAQLLVLRPISERFGKLEEAEKTKEGLEYLKKFVPYYYADKELTLRLANDEELETQQSERTGELTELQSAQDSDNEQQVSLVRAIESDKVGARINDIVKEIEAAGKQRDTKQAALNKIKGNIGVLGLSTAINAEEQFTALRHKLLMEKGTVSSNLTAQEQKRVDVAVNKRQLETQRDQVAREAQSVRNARVLIPHQLLEIREAICDGTGVGISELPFAGELIEVKSEHKQWTGAIERLLHGFGISLLVPESRYSTVTSFVNKTHLGGRFVYLRVPAATQPPKPDIMQDPRRVPARLHFKEDSPLIRWVQSEIAQRFNHICCSNVQQLNDVDFGITVEGLIRNRNRHVKDDSARIDDRSHYVLGWNTQAKLASLMEEVQNLSDRIKTTETKLQQADEQVATTKRKIAAMEAILEVDDFSTINPAVEREKIDRLDREKASLTASNDKIRQLQKELEKTKERLAKRGEKISELNQVIGGIKNKRETNQKVVNKLRQLVKGPPEGFADATEGIVASQEEKKLTIDNIADVKEAVEKKIQNKINAQTSIITQATNFLLPEMQAFLTAYPEETKDLKAGIEYGPGFVKLTNQIDKEQLPVYKERFFSLLNQELILSLAAFKSKLEQDEKDIKERIDSVNASLRKIEFTPGTYARVIIAPARSDEIKVFLGELRACLSSGIQPDEAELKRIFEQIRKLITRFDKEPDWTNRVTDVRNWLDYGVKRLSEQDGSEVEYYAGSSGKSGGQKSFLAFMILGSAITAQYGLTGNGDDRDCFRVIAVDEVFGKTDEAFSQRVLELFKKLDLQLIIVNPFDAKSRIVEDYVDSYHLVTERDNESTLKRASRVEYEAAQN
jgi:uncharacterized protein YPO0396